MHLKIEEMLDYTDEEREKWKAWFLRSGDDKLKLALAGETHRSIGQLLTHIFWSELFYAFWMKGKSLTEDDDDTRKFKAMSFDSAENVFVFGRFTRDEMRSFTSTADKETWERSYEFSGHGFHLKGTARQLISHILIHETRHWAQVAIIVRENGFAPPGDHDLIFSKNFGTTIERL